MGLRGSQAPLSGYSQVVWRMFWGHEVVSSILTIRTINL